MVLLVGALKEAAENAVEYALRCGASDCDVVGCSSRHITAELEKGSMKQASMADDIGIGIRAFSNGCSGFSHCADLRERQVKRMAELAVSLAKGGTPDPDFRQLPEPRKVSKNQELYDSRIAKLGAEEVVELAIRLADGAGMDPRITSVNAIVSAGHQVVCLINSRGVSLTQKMSSFDSSAEVVAGSKANMFSGTEVSSSRRLDRNMLDKVGTGAREHALMGLSKTRIATGDYPVVMDPLAAGFLLVTSLGGGANADAVQRNRSYLAGRLGKSVGSSCLTVTDDATVGWASGSYSFDGEGTPAGKNLVIDKGVLRTYLHDSYTSGKESAESTGNSSRGGALWSYRAPPSISSSNLVVKPGTSTAESLTEDVKKGVYLRLTWDYPNLTTGEFSGLMMESYRIEDGELGPSIRQSTIGIGLLELFERIEAVAKNPRDAFGVITPALMISKARIGGSG